MLGLGFAGLSALIPLIPGWIEAGVATYGLFQKIRTMIDEDRSLTAAERAQLEQMIATDEARVNDTSRDV